MHHDDKEDMNIIHFSDTHLGYQAYDLVTPEGINTREQDVYDAFERVVDRIVALQPDLVIHSGDFFHRPSPSNRALTFGLEQLKRISRLHIPVVIISGNHETPKTVYNSPILRALQSIDHVVPIFGESAEVRRFGQVAIHGVPHINDNELLFNALSGLQPMEGAFNILMLHTSLGKRYLMEEYGERIFPPEFESKLEAFQYIALGHWHNYQKISLHENAWYAGSTERMSDSEIGTEKGFIVIEVLDENRCNLQFESIKTRPWLRLDISQCHEKAVSELWTILEGFKMNHSTDQAILSLNLEGIKPEQSFELSTKALKNLFPDAFNLIVKRSTWNDRTQDRTLRDAQFDSLDQLFFEYVSAKYPEDEATKAKILDRAMHYFRDSDI